MTTQTKLLAADNDRDMLEYLHDAFSSQVNVCDNCGHETATSECDSASDLRDYLAAAPASPQAVKKLHMVHVAKALESVRGKPVMTSNQCHDLAQALNDSLRAELQPASPQAAQPVAWQLTMNGEQKDISGRMGIPSAWANLQRHGYNIEGLYTHADAGEVERLRAELVTAKEILERWYRLNVQREAKVDALQQRLTAADERADVLETALKKISARCVAYIEAEREMPEPSVEVCQMIASAALRPAESAKDEHVCSGCGSKGWTANCKECVPY
ncbi:hypothetical protein HBO01_03470 [Pseudomonas rhodesiae]|uniref:hypothetical protein n=1 Tax=Pseudomonas rhodesiae TaxID=76760 RepID=UPI0014756610|nr:hypothetical protein [Pseudomonas rhodesiae]NMY77735.1 hypothetical protein [Pseudomonas rhodesiae]